MTLPEWLSLASVTEKVIGAIVAVSTGIGALIWWVDRRLRGRVKDGLSELTASSNRRTVRLDGLEKRMANVEIRLKEDGERLAQVERTLETVARSEDLAPISAKLDAMDAGTGAQLRMMSGQVDTLYKAALAAGKSK